MKNQSSKKGFVILYAVLVAAVVAAIGIAVADLVSRQLFLANISRESQRAYYAASTARSCIKYWDSRRFFGEILDASSPTPGYRPAKSSDLQTMETNNCGWGISGTYTQTLSNPSGNQATLSVFVKIGNPEENLCARAQVIKRFGDNTLRPLSQIIVDGYNISCDALTSPPDPLPPRTVQRTLISQ